MSEETKGQVSSGAPDVVRLDTDHTVIPGWARFLPVELDKLQTEVAHWERKNFGSQPSVNPLLGVVEEVGELAHAHLKMVQGIRHSPMEIDKQIDDAIGDIMIYLLNYCSRTGRRLEHCIAKAWDEVSKRDWLKDMPRCAVCGNPIPLADLIRVRGKDVVHMSCVDKYESDQKQQ